jgi:transposase
MQPLSKDLRERILYAVDNREGSRRRLAARFKVNTSTITRLLQLRRQTGSVEPRPHGGGVAPTLDHDALDRLRKLVEETPDATLEALKQKLGVSSSRMIILVRVPHGPGAVARRDQNTEQTSQPVRPGRRLNREADSLKKTERRIEQLEHAMDVQLRQRYGPRSECLEPNQLRRSTEEGDESLPSR